MRTVTKIISGKTFAEEQLCKLCADVRTLYSRCNVIPRVDVIIVGEDPASQLYVRLKAKRAEECGIQSNIHRFDKDTTQEKIVNTIARLNIENTCHGILVQLPLPKHMDTHIVLNTVNPNKDIDGFTTHNIGLLFSQMPCFVPCTPLGVILLIKRALGENITGKRALVIGRSLIVGRPTAELLLQENCTVTIAHSRSLDVYEQAREADILVVAVGVPKLVNKKWIKEGACVIDVGITQVQNQVVGDVDTEDVMGVAGYITPVPGGVGPMTIMCVLKNVLRAAENAAKCT